MNTKHQPVIIEVTHTEGDNEISFALRGSVEWMKQMNEFILSNLKFTSQLIWESDPESHAEILEGLDALSHRRSFNGNFVTITIAKEDK